uniref:NR LBD domain-containing protein n=1 Tax=Caenorhabditis tropicalis TaxID=1561998 RepID=A0A1I7TAR6_9PELO
MLSDPLSKNSKAFIDVQHLILEASRLLNQGCEVPFKAENQLKKLSLGSNFLKFDVDKMRFFAKIGRQDIIDIIEYYFVTVVKWIMRFDEFQNLDRGYQMTLLESIWHVWMKTHKCSSTADFRKSSYYKKPKQKIFRNMCVDTDIAKVDTSWMSDYPHEYVNLYLRSQAIYEADVMESIRNLNPTDVELTFMFAQICFEYAGKRFQGDILKITDRFQQVLSNDLHTYYTEEAHNPRYIQRLSDLMKVNNMIQKSIWTSRPQRELNRVFNVMKIGSSHPNMFEDSIFH